MKRTSELLTRKWSRGADKANLAQDRVGRILLDIQGKVQRRLARYARHRSANAVDEAVSYAMMETVAALERLSVDEELAALPIEDRLEAFMLAAAEAELNRIRRRAGRWLSLDAPIGEETEGESLTMMGKLAYQRYTATHVEDHADAMSIARAADTMCKRDRDIFLTLADGLTAEDAAKELGISPHDVRLERTRIIRRVKEVRGRV